MKTTTTTTTTATAADTAACSIRAGKFNKKDFLKIFKTTYKTYYFKDISNYDIEDVIKILKSNSNDNKTFYFISRNYKNNELFKFTHKKKISLITKQLKINYGIDDADKYFTNKEEIKHKYFLHYKTSNININDLDNDYSKLTRHIDFLIKNNDEKTLECGICFNDIISCDMSLCYNCLKVSCRDCFISMSINLLHNKKKPFCNFCMTEF